MFNRECMGDAHTPCSCQQWSQWMSKISEVKPDKIRETTAEYEEAANSLWLVTNSKPCPNCNSPIQKNEGCNHMKCSKVIFILFRKCIFIFEYLRKLSISLYKFEI